MFYEIGVFKNFAKFTGKHLRWSFCNLYSKQTPTQVFPCEFCEVFQNTFFTEHLRTFCEKENALFQKGFWQNNSYCSIIFPRADSGTLYNIRWSILPRDLTACRR